MNVVVDTNIIAYYWLPGAHTESAVSLRRHTDEWFVPTLWRSEFRNVLARYLRAGMISPAQASALIRSAEAELVDGERDVDSAAVMGLVAKSACAAYDCEFVALAKSMGYPLVTEDTRIVRTFPETAVTMDDLLAGQ